MEEELKMSQTNLNKKDKKAITLIVFWFWVLYN